MQGEGLSCSPVSRGASQGLCLSINTPPGGCMYHLTCVSVAREKLICCRHSVFQSGILAQNIILHIYMLFSRVSFSLVLKMYFLQLFLEELFRPQEKDGLLPVHLAFMLPLCGLTSFSFFYVRRVKVCGVHERQGLTEPRSPPALQHSRFRQALWHRTARSAFCLGLQGCLPRQQTGPLCGRKAAVQASPSCRPSSALLCPVVL